MATTKQWPTWMIVVAFLILIPPIVWALNLVIGLATAMTIGGMLLVVAIVWLFVWLRGRVEA